MKKPIFWFVTTALGMIDVTPAFAQSVVSEQSEGYDNAAIVVTARKREESLQDVPLTVSAVSERQISESNLNDGLALASLTPGFTFETLGTSQQAKPVIRGVTTNALSPSAQLNSSFVDGVFVAGTPAPAPFIDLQRVEVLKGPQSTAFGRATFTGAIDYITRDPGNNYQIIGEALAGTENTYELSALVSGPLVADKILLLVSGAYLSTDGNDEWVNSDGTKLGARETLYGSAKLIVRPSDSIQLKLRYSYLEFDESPDAVIFAGNARSQAGGFGANQRTTAYITPSGASNFYPTGVFSRSTQSYVRDFAQVDDPGTNIRKNRFHGELNAEISGHDLTISAAHNTEDTFSWPGEQDNRVCRGSNGLGGTGYCPRSRQTYDDSQFEIRIASPSDRTFRYLFGMSYIDLVSTNVSYQPKTGTIFLPNPKEEIKSYAPFASIEFDATDRLTIGLEARYNFDDQTFTPYAQCLHLGFLNQCANFPEAKTGVPTAASIRPAVDSNFRAFVYRATAGYQITDDFLTYAIVSRGMQPGRINTNIDPNGPLGQFAEQAQGRLTNYEVGLKGAMLNNKLSFNLAVYNMDISGYPQRITVVDPAAPNVGIGIFADRGEVRIRGLELESTFALSPNFRLRGTLAYTDAKFQNFCSNNLFLLTRIDDTAASTRDQCRFVNGNQLEAQPKWDASLLSRVTIPVGGNDGQIFFQPEFSYQSSKYASEMNLARTPNTSLFNLRVGYQTGKLLLEAFGTNLTKESSPVRLSRLTAFDLANDPGGDRQTLGFVPRQDRRFGFRVRVNFD